jgi:hypothetical protein
MATLLTIICGALAGGITSLLVNEFRDGLRLKRATSGLSLKAERRAGSRVTARVRNESNYCIERATAYVTVHHDLEDVLSPPLHFAAFVSPKHMRKVQEDRLCWSVTMPDRNPMCVDIFSGEWQSLDVADFGAMSQWIEIPSEMAYSSNQTAAEVNGGTVQISSRVFLRAGKKYRATIKIVSKVTTARSFEIEIDATNVEQPVREVAS